MSPAESAGTSSGTTAASARSAVSAACVADQPKRKHGAGARGWNIEPGRVTTSIGRKCPSFGASPPLASIVMTTREMETVIGRGQLTGPRVASGAFV